mgnify:CR=1 FL=1
MYPTRERNPKPMMHKNRIWQIKDVDSAIELAADLKAATWTRCSGWRFGDTVWLNDSTCEDGLQEYAVLRDEDHGNYRQLESITVSWCETGQLVESSTQMADAPDEQFMSGTFGIHRLNVQAHAQHGRCPLCA